MTPTKKFINYLIYAALCFSAIPVYFSLLAYCVGADIEAIIVAYLHNGLDFTVFFNIAAMWFILFGIGNFLGAIGRQWQFMSDDKSCDVLLALKSYPELDDTMRRIAALDRKLYVAESEFILGYKETKAEIRQKNKNQKAVRELYGKRN